MFSLLSFLSLKSLLDSDTGAKNFEAQLSKEFSDENLAFWEGVRVYRQIDDGRSPNDRGAQWFIARCSDGKWLIVLPNTDPQWEAFTRVALERPDLFDKAPDMPSRLRVQDEM